MDKTWWVDTSHDAKGLMLITFDKKKFYIPFEDYLLKTTFVEREIFDKENLHFGDFFSDRN